MSEPGTEAPETSADDAQEQQEQKPAETVEFWRQKAREQEKRAKENAAAAKRLNEIEEANKSDLEKANGKIATAEAERDDARAEATRLRVAVKHGISLEDADLFLTGTDEETLTAQARRLTDREADRAKNGNYAPREGANHRPAETEDTAFARALFSRE